MMKKWTFIYLLFCVSVFAACDDEDDLKPSYADEERIEGLLDLSKPLVKEYKEKYGVNILYHFDDTLDFKFGFYTTGSNGLWGNIEIQHLETDENVDFALETLDEMVFSCFTDEFKKCLPYKILLADAMSSVNTSLDALKGEMDVEETSSSATVLANSFSYMFTFNKESMEGLSETRLKNLRDVKLYHLISYVFNKANLYEKIPESFYADVNHLHGENVDMVAHMEEELPIGTGSYKSYYKPEWYIDLGMALTKRSPLRTTRTRYEQYLALSSSKTFPDKRRDFRNFLSVMIFPTKESLEKYFLTSELFCKRMRIAMEVLESVGVDPLKINPDLEMFNE